jgi:hypothetical protein
MRPGWVQTADGWRRTPERRKAEAEAQRARVAKPAKPPAPVVRARSATPAKPSPAAIRAARLSELEALARISPAAGPSLARLGATCLDLPAEAWKAALALAVAVEPVEPKPGRLVRRC